MNFRVQFPTTPSGLWRIIEECEPKPRALEAKSILILKPCEALCEVIDKDNKECYILVTGAEKERHGDVVVLK
jgi:hypothetical protein